MGVKVTAFLVFLGAEKARNPTWLPDVAIVSPYLTFFIPCTLSTLVFTSVTQGYCENSLPATYGHCASEIISCTREYPEKLN